MSDQPKPTGEWTAERIMQYDDRHALADAINAALAASQKALAEEVDCVHKTLKQLDAERGKYVAQREDWIREIQEIQTQLAAEREAIRYWKEQWVERGAQLAAQKQQAESMLATSKRVNDQLREQLAATQAAIKSYNDNIYRYSYGTPLAVKEGK